MSKTVHGRLHTIPDIDAGRIADNPSVLAHYTPPDVSAKRPWYFGGANQRMYLPQGALENVGAKGSYLTYGKVPKKSPYTYYKGGKIHDPTGIVEYWKHPNSNR